MRSFYILSFVISLSVFASKNGVPVISSGEVKILYSCSDLSALKVSGEEQEQITFYEKSRNDLRQKGLIFRHIKTADHSDEFTVKFRSPNNSALVVDENIYRSLSATAAGKLKCELDLSYDPVNPKSVPSCSFKAPSASLVGEHFDFMEMMGVSLPGFRGDLSSFRQVKILATKWKLKDRGPFAKKPSVERWQFRNECILEVSAKFTANSTNPSEVRKTALSAIKTLKELVPAAPAPVQSSKTARALDF